MWKKGNNEVVNEATFGTSNRLQLSSVPLCFSPFHTLTTPNPLSQHEWNA